MCGAKSPAMYDDPLDSVLINGASLKQRVLASVSDTAVLSFASRNPERYATPGAPERPNIFRARREAVASRMEKCDSSDAWVREIVGHWCRISGLKPTDADFFREPGFMEAVRQGRDIQVRRYLDDDEWGWIVIRDIPSHWLQRRRLPETIRQEMLTKKRRKEADRRQRF